MKTTYVILLTYTDQGVSKLKESPKRALEFRKRTEDAGIKVLSQLWTTGAYDGLLILESDSEEKVLSTIAQLASLGNVRTHSLRAFDAADFAKLVGA